MNNVVVIIMLKHLLTLQLREFSICGQCQQVRYCGPHCQEVSKLVQNKFLCSFLHSLLHATCVPV